MEIGMVSISSKGLNLWSYGQVLEKVKFKYPVSGTWLAVKNKNKNFVSKPRRKEAF